MRKPLVAFLDRVLGPDDLVALMTPEMAGSDIALGRKTDVIEKIVSETWWGRRARIAGKDPKELLYEECLPPDRTTLLRGDPLLHELINRRREKLTLDALDDLMTHLAGLRDERKAVVLVTEGWLLYQPNPKLAEQGQPANGSAWRRARSNLRCYRHRSVDRLRIHAGASARRTFKPSPPSTATCIFGRLRRTRIAAT